MCWLFLGLGSALAGDLSPAASSLVDQTWVLQTLDVAGLRTYIDHAGWAALVQERDYLAAARHFGPTGAASARAHAELSAQYSQAAVLAAYSLKVAYDDNARPEDPKGRAHLLTVAYATLGQRDAAKAWSAKYEGGDRAALWHAPWKTWLAGTAPWPPDFTALPVRLPPVSPGSAPPEGSFPHYSLPHNGAGGSVDMADPGLLLALARWHRDAAVDAADDPEVVDLFIAPWRTPADPPVTSQRALPMQMLFGSCYLTPLDAAFLADLTGKGGKKAVPYWQDKSLVANVAANARTFGHLDPLAIQDQVEEIREQMLARAAAANGGHVLPPHKLFSNIARSALYWDLAVVADVEGEKETAGLLRIYARDAATRTAESHPTPMLAYAAWDARNHFTMRALEIVHSQSQWDPVLKTARYAVESLDLRLQHLASGEGPM